MPYFFATTATNVYETYHIKNIGEILMKKPRKFNARKEVRSFKRANKYIQKIVRVFNKHELNVFYYDGSNAECSLYNLKNMFDLVIQALEAEGKLKHRNK